MGVFSLLFPLLGLIFQGSIATDELCTGPNGLPEADGSYPFPGECSSSFYICLAGESTLSNCGELIFDPEVLECVSDGKASCFLASASEGTPEATEVTQGTEETESTPSDINTNTPATTSSVTDTPPTESSSSSGGTTSSSETTATQSSTESATSSSETTATQSSTESTTSSSETTKSPDLDQLQTDFYITAGVLGGVCLILVGGLGVLFFRITTLTSKLNKPSSGGAAAAFSADSSGHQLNVYRVDSERPVVGGTTDSRSNRERSNFGGNAPGSGIGMGGDFGRRIQAYQPGRGLPRAKIY